MHRTASALAVLALATGCGGGRAADVEQAAAAWSGALRSGDAGLACSMLAPLTRQGLESSEQQPCAEAISGQDLLAPSRQRSVDRFGREARVVVEGADGETDTWFLSRFGGRWLVVAAGCQPRGGGLPYHCDVEGA